jgi:hypothetical protein
LRRLVLLPTLAIVLALSVAATATAEASPATSHAVAVQALQAARDAFATPLSGGSSSGSRDVTVALRDLAVALPALRGADREAARDLLARPTDKNDRRYFGKEAGDSPICDPQFCVHWTDKAKNAPVSHSFINDILDAMALSYSVENTNLGWKQAKSDGKLGKRHGIGGDGQVDVYITNLGKNLYGYASTDGGQRGSKRYAYLVLDNNYVGFPTPPTESMQVTVAHEYNHILQFNYDVFEDVWLFEDTATWAEEQVYPGINDYLNYLPAFAAKPQVPMTGSSIKIYSEAIWNHWLSYKYGKDLIRRTWVVSPSERNFAVDSYNRVIKDADGSSSFGEELGQFFTDTAEFRSSSAFPDAAAYPNVKRSGTVGSRPKKTTLDNTSFRLYDVHPTADPSTTLKVKAEKGTQSTIALIGRQGGEPGVISREVNYLPKGGRGTVTLDNPGAFDRITAVVANVDGRSKHTNRKGKRIYSSDGSGYKLSLGG